MEKVGDSEQGRADRLKHWGTVLALVGIYLFGIGSYMNWQAGGGGDAFWIGSALCMGLACAFTAKAKGRSPAWGLLGVALGLIGYCVVWSMRSRVVISQSPQRQP